MNPGQGISPSDASPRKRWPVWRKVLAYLFMMALASASIYLIDKLAMKQAQNFNSQPASNPG